MELPPRSPALDGRRMRLSFDVDCGELLPGHHFVARGLSDEDAWGWDGSDERAVPGLSLEYELVPGIPPDTMVFDAIVPIEYEADVALPWDPNDSGAIAPFEGGTSTHGSRGAWPLPEGARILTFTVPKHRLNGGDGPGGGLVVDLQQGTARWTPDP